MLSEPRGTMIEAINNYSQYSPSQKQVLITLLNISVNNEAKLTVNDINQATGITRATILTALSVLNKDGVIVIQRTKGNRFTGCELIESKLNNIVLHHKSKQDLIK